MLSLQTLNNCRLTLLMLALAISAMAQKSGVERAFAKAGLVEDLEQKAPRELAKVTYQGGVETKLGNLLNTTQVKEQPEVKWKKAQGPGKGKLYTVAMVDADANGNQTNRQFLHWMVVNVPGQNITAGNAVQPYLGAAPPTGSGPHRYVILVYAQCGMMSTDQPENAYTPNFDIHGFAVKNGLGKPIAGNFFTAQTV